MLRLGEGVGVAVGRRRIIRVRQADVAGVDGQMARFR